jgi:hypothetical protein
MSVLPEAVLNIGELMGNADREADTITRIRAKRGEIAAGAGVRRTLVGHDRGEVTGRGDVQW